MTIFEELEQELTTVTDRMLEKVNSVLDDPAEGEEILATASLRAQRIWGLCADYRRRASLHEHAARFDLDTEEDKDVSRAACRRCNSMAELASNWAWLEVHAAIGVRGWRESVGVRKGFVIVTCKDDDEEEGVEATMKSLGAIKVPLEGLMAFRSALKRMMEARETDAPKENPEDRKKKVQ
jgi:hypothetical protein